MCYAIIGYTIALCTLSIQRLLIDNIENDINVALVVAHKRHICCSGPKRVKLAQFALLKSSLSNTLIAGFNFGEHKGGDISMFVSTVNIQ